MYRVFTMLTIKLGIMLSIARLYRKTWLSVRGKEMNELLRSLLQTDKNTPLPNKSWHDISSLRIDPELARNWASCLTPSLQSNLGFPHKEINEVTICKVELWNLLVSLSPPRFHLSKKSQPYV